MILSYWFVQIISEVCLLNTHYVFSHWVVQIISVLSLLTTSDRFLLLDPKHIEVYLLTTHDIFLLLGPNNLRSGSTYYM